MFNKNPLTKSVNLFAILNKGDAFVKGKMSIIINKIKRIVSHTQQFP